jgi:FkbM family methyltransferase
MRSPLIVKCIHNGKYNVFTIADDEYIGPTINAGYEWDGWMRKDLERYYKKGTDIIDIGANIGYNALMFSDYGPVHAYEPLFHKIVKMNIEKNILKNTIELKPYALSDKTQTIPMYYPNSVNTTGLRNYGGSSMYLKEWSDESSKTDVECHRLDDVYTGIPSIIKIDVEGHELEVLKGAEQIIRKYKPTILIEIFEFEKNEVSKFIKTLGYGTPEERPEHVYLYNL